MDPVLLQSALAAVPAGAWAVGVSGGADSVALLCLLRQRPDLSLHVVHLDHQTRGPASTGDARFVEQLACQWNLPHTIALRGDLEARLPKLAANPSARYRAVRMALFQQVVHACGLKGVILAHHADDQAETVLHRLLRGHGSHGAGLAGMAPQTTLHGLRVLRPLLAVPREVLRRFLADHGQAWREDASNASPKYLRNRLRQLLALHPELSGDLVALASAARALRQWSLAAAPRLPAAFNVAQLHALPPILSWEAARRWLLDQGVAPEDLEAPVIERLLTMANDAASPPQQHFPGRCLVRRKGGVLFVAQRT